MRSILVGALVAFLSVACAADEPTQTAEPSPKPSQAAAPAGSPMPTPTFGFATVLIDTDEGSVIIDAEKAETPEQHQLGYMFRETVGPDEGMVFLFNEERAGGFWMKNVVVPLSIAFFDQEGYIVSILDMEPCEADPCEIYDPLYDQERATTYWGALEVKQGQFEEWGVQVGDRIKVTH
jgi:uncharacterized membrane protein (UPF0127 family)